LIELSRVFLNFLLEPIDIDTHVPIRLDSHCLIELELTLVDNINDFLMSCFLCDNIKDVLLNLFLFLKRLLVLGISEVTFLL